MSEKKILFVDDTPSTTLNQNNVDIDTFDDKSITVSKLKETIENDDDNDDIVSLNESFNSNNNDEQENQNDESIEDINILSGGDSSDASSVSSIDTIKTADVLSIDPMYYRLTKFLQTAGGTNVADILDRMTNQLDTLNNNIEKMAKIAESKS